ncbi:disulfide oxidoreductase [Viridibacillus sp. FSL R5-0477]|uniref:Thiol-disulfide oxdoreductase BdbC n=1 Tax=Viridibacillus arenosi FSL R5-213 TaxID=1227360 RepID=W4F565_9BACL|nr:MULTISPECIES: disulfide oxidoreductase [Viridibacillus]ETT87487.1 Thiol-disulfide oxdoreductase BdbC [Viridibacillus arenosi FSL R5-213]OMC82550.1 disulfide bond formation protein B [Viridibacillus sp. FSL H8-0123]OMC87708.1 disulfide bond formation protein B [Viridibacillus sp. FSL H7-0596]OMC91252.1 disulfide bond formation protein B [Viridibacillus arenosi]
MVNKALLFGWITSIIAMMGSLFFSEKMGFIPCTLCWYQRILMYPLVFFLGMAFYRNDKAIYKYVLPMSTFGMLLSGYHYALQKIPSMHEFSTCTNGVPCSGQYINWFGFVTIPFLSFIGFTLITISMLVLWKRK